MTTSTERFSLACILCDDGADIHCEHEAVAAGWRDVTPDPLGLGWNHLGVCPSCVPDWFGETAEKGTT